MVLGRSPPRRVHECGGTGKGQAGADLEAKKNVSLESSACRSRSGECGPCPRGVVVPKLTAQAEERAMEKTRSVVWKRVEKGGTGAGAGSVAAGVGDMFRGVDRRVFDTNLASASGCARAFTPPCAVFILA